MDGSITPTPLVAGAMVLVYAMVILTEVDVYLIASCRRVSNIIYHALRTAMLAQFGNSCCIAYWGYPLTERFGDGFGTFLVSHERLNRMKLVGCKKRVVPKCALIVNMSYIIWFV